MARHHTLVTLRADCRHRYSGLGLVIVQDAKVAL
jgi:hypothetical protein